MHATYAVNGMAGARDVGHLGTLVPCDARKLTIYSNNSAAGANTHLRYVYCRLYNLGKTFQLCF